MPSPKLRCPRGTLAIFTAFALAGLAGCSKKLKSGSATLDEPEPPVEASHEGETGQWTGHLGSLRNGRSAETLGNDNWQDAEPESVWNAQIGTGAAGIVVDAGHLYTVGNSDDKDTVFCLDAESGEQKWAVSYPCELDTRQFEGGPAATPTLDPAGGCLFVLSHEGELRCLGIADGAELWRKHLVEDFGGRRPKWGFAGAPLLVGGTLIVEAGGDGSSVVALNPDDGSEKWRAGDDECGYAAPIQLPTANGTAVAVFNAFGLVAYSIANGSELFRQRWKTNYDVNAATPLYSRGHVFLASGYGKGGGLVSVKGNSPEIVYETRDAIAQFQSPILIGDHLYLVTGDNNTKSRLNCIAFVDGSLVWTEPVGGNRGNVIAVGGHLIAVTERGEAILCEASPASFEEKGRFQAVGGRVWAPPAFAGGLLFVRNNAGELRAWNLR